MLCYSARHKTVNKVVPHSNAKLINSLVITVTNRYYINVPAVFAYTTCFKFR
jgi:hypothetical protein